MPFQTTPEINFAETGLVTDMPAHSLPPGAWSECLNMRVKDSSVQGVNTFEDSFAITGEPYAITQWTPTGKDDLYIAYVYKDESGNGRVAVFNQTTGETVQVTNDNADAAFTLNDKYPPQIFVFNDLLVVNPATGNPQYMLASSIFKKFNSDLEGAITYTHNAADITKVVGVGTNFQSLVACEVGATIIIGDQERVIESIEGETELHTTVSLGYTPLTGVLDPEAGTKVIGDNTLFTSELAVGDSIRVSGVERTIEAINSDTELLVTSTFEYETLTGTIDPEDSVTVTGVGTLFESELHLGDKIVVSGEERIVTDITSDTSLIVSQSFGSQVIEGSIQPPETGTTVTGINTFFDNSQLSQGDFIKVSGVEREIASITSPTELEVTESFEYESLSGTMSRGTDNKVDGVETNFESELAVGETIMIDGVRREVMYIEDDHELYVTENWEYDQLSGMINPTDSVDVVGNDDCKFDEELLIGDSILISGQTRTVASIEDFQKLTVDVSFGSLPFTGASGFYASTTDLSVTVSGSGTSFTNDLTIEDEDEGTTASVVLINGEERTVDAIASDISFTVTTAFTTTAQDTSPWVVAGLNPGPDYNPVRVNGETGEDESPVKVWGELENDESPLKVHIDLANDTAPEVYYGDLHYVYPSYKVTALDRAVDNDPQVAAEGGALTDLPNWIVYPATYSDQDDVDADPAVYDYFGVEVTELNQWMTVVPAIARVIKPFKSRLVALSLLNDKDTSTEVDDVKFPADWNVSTVIVTADSLQAVDWNATPVNDVDYGVLTQTPGKILDGNELGDSFMIYKSDSVIKMTYTGDPNTPFTFQTITEDDGVYSNRCVANIGDQMHLVVGNYGVYMVDANGQRQHIAKGIFQDALFDLIYPQERERAFTFHQTRDKEVWLCLSSKNNKDPITDVRLKGCDIAFVWNYESNSLHMRSLPDVSDLYETEVDGELAIYAASPTSDNLLKLSNDKFEPNGFFARRNDPVGDATVIKQVNSAQISAEGKLKVAISGVFNTLDNPDYLDASFDPSKNFKVDTRAQGRYLSMRVTMNGDENPKLTTMQFEFKPTGKR
ncbi:MAG: hypothetical protein NZ824_05410 [Candidatus Thioglobus sp.]|nr:hypothetical protein [Candidatus Thioglobus sp.]